MNAAIYIRFATPYLNSITRDDVYVHSLNPLDGAIAYALFWRLAIANNQGGFETEGIIGDSALSGIITEELEKIFVKRELGDANILDNGRKENVFIVSSGFPVSKEGVVYVRVGARYERLADVLSLGQSTSASLQPRRVVQPLRKRVDPMRLVISEIQPLQKHGKPMTKDIETGKAGLKSIDSRIVTWEIFEYVWFANLTTGGKSLLADALDLLKFQGMGKKRSAGFGKVIDYSICDKNLPFRDDQITNEIFWNWRDGQKILMRPIPFVATTGKAFVLTNQILEFSGGTLPPYWNERQTVIREGTIFDFT